MNSSSDKSIMLTTASTILVPSSEISNMNGEKEASSMETCEKRRPGGSNILESHARRKKRPTKAREPFPK